MSSSKSAERPDAAVPEATPNDGSISNAIVRVARLHRMLAGQLLRSVGLYPGQELVMMQLWNGGPQSQIELVKALGSDAATITRTVRRLEHAGFVRRCAHPADKRVVMVEPTEASIALREKIERMWNELDHSTTTGFTSADRDAALRVLHRVEDSLTSAIVEQ